MSKANDKKPSGKDAPPPPVAPPPRPPPKKPRAVPLGDVCTDGVLPLNDAYVAAPSLSEAHMYYLEKTIQHRCKVQAQVIKAVSTTSNRQPSENASSHSRPPSALSHHTPFPGGDKSSAMSSLFQPGGGVVGLSSSMAPRSPSKDRASSQFQSTAAVATVSPQFMKRAERFVYPAETVCGRHPTLPQHRSTDFEAAIASSKAEKTLASQYPVDEANVMRVMAYYRQIHGASLRVHEELSRNLRVNIADLALVERQLYEAWERDSDMPSLLALASLTMEKREPTGTSIGFGGGSSVSASSGGVPALGSSSLSYFSDATQSLLPPVSILVLFLWTCDAQDVVSLFSGDDAASLEATAAAASSGKGTSGGAANKAESASVAKATLMVRVRERIAQAIARQEQDAATEHNAAATKSHRDSSSDGMGGATAAEGGDGGVAAAASAFGAASTAAKEDFSRGVRSLTELRLALQNRRSAYLINKWAGTLSVLLATLQTVHAVVAPPAVPPPAAVATAMGLPSGVGAASGVGGQLSSRSQPSSRPESGRSTKSNNSAASDSADGRLALRCQLHYPNTAAALAALEHFATSSPEGYACPLPPLLSMTASSTLIPSAPSATLRRVEDFVMPNMDVDDEGVLRTFEDKQRLLCQGWYVQPKPPPEEEDPAALLAQAAGGAPPAVDAARRKSDAKPPPAPTPAAKKPPTPKGKGKRRDGTPGELPPITAENEAQYLAELPKHITVELIVDHGTDHVIDLRNFCSNHPTDEEYLIPPLTQVRVHMIVPEQLKLCLRVINYAPLFPRKHDHVPALAGGFYERVLSDGRKASAVAAKICTRLVNQFVQPHHCHRHPSQTYTAFCHDCRRFICAACGKDTHSAHRTEGISSMCHTMVMQRIQPGMQLLSRRAELLRSLLGKLDHKRGVMRRLVDAGIDDVQERVVRRRVLLHEDAARRADVQLQQLSNERELCLSTLTSMRAKFACLEAVRTGIVPEAPVTWKPLLTHQVLDYLHPRLPTQQVCSLIAVLTWSNPSKYLVHTIYPPEAVVPTAAGAHSAEDAADDAGQDASRSALSSRSGCRAIVQQSTNYVQGTSISVSEEFGGDHLALPAAMGGDTSGPVAVLGSHLPLATSQGGDSEGIDDAVKAMATTDALVHLRRVGDDGSAMGRLGKDAWMQQHVVDRQQRNTEEAFPFLSRQAEEAKRAALLYRSAAAKYKQRH